MPFLVQTTIRITSTASEMRAGVANARQTLPNDVLRHASRGPTAVRKTRKRPIGTIMVLKKGAPTVILYPRTHSERIGKSVPHSTAKQAPSRTRLLKRKLDSRETSDSSLFSDFK